MFLAALNQAKYKKNGHVRQYTVPEHVDMPSYVHR